MSDVLLKNVDSKVYAQLKAEAASERKTMGAVFNEAVRAWLVMKRQKDPERERNVEVYKTLKTKIAQHPKDYFVIARGEYVGRFQTLSQAFSALKRNHVTKAIIVRSQPEGEWLGGSLEA